MKDKDSRLIWEAWDAPGGRPANRGLGSDGNGGPRRSKPPPRHELHNFKYHDDVAFKSHAWDEHYLGHDFDAIQELVDFLKSEFEEGTHYKLHVGRGDDLPNTVSIHKKFQAPEHLEGKLAELLDGASGPPEGEGDDSDDWFESTEDRPFEGSREFGIHARPDAGQALSDYGLKIVRKRVKGHWEEDQIDELLLIKPIGRAALEDYGPPQNEYGAYDVMDKSEMRGHSLEEFEQIVIRSINNHGKPMFFRPYAKPEEQDDRAGLLPGEDPERSWQDNPGVYPPGYNQ
jgi:hypothetical protein